MPKNRVNSLNIDQVMTFCAKWHSSNVVKIHVLLNILFSPSQIHPYAVHLPSCQEVC